MKRVLIPPCVLLAAAAVVAGCGGTKKASASARAQGTSTGGATAISAKKTALGTILVDGSGHTLYLFESDKSSKSSCSGACVSTWPPVTTSAAPTAGAGIDPSKLSVITRPDGTRQVAYSGHPLYRFEGDTSAGSLNGQNQNAFGGDWYVVSMTGAEIDKPVTSGGGCGQGPSSTPSSPGGSSSSGGSGSSGGAYGY